MRIDVSTLLMSLGTSPAVVPEAVLWEGVAFQAVHVLTTASVKQSDLDWIADWFRRRAPDVELSFTRVAKFSDFRSEADHFLFEEVMYRWWLEKSAGERPWVCLAGGFKTMSAAMQKAAAVLGAAEVFHVIAENVPDGGDGKSRPPATEEEIDDSLAHGRLHWIRLGPESGWPQLRYVLPSQYPLTTTQQDGLTRWVTVVDQAFRDRLREVVERSHNVAGAWDRLGNLPFPVLATWSAEQLAWLDAPVDPAADREWLAALPKIELHCHLGGFATHGPLLHEVRAAADRPDSLPPLVEPPLPSDWPIPATPIGLQPYLHLGDATGRALLRDPGCLRRQCELLYDHLVEHNVVHAEIRCSPNNYTSPGRSAFDVLADIRAAFESKISSARVPHDGPVPARVPRGGPVPARVPRGGVVPAAVPADVPETSRDFIPFDRDAEYRQTWRDLPHRYQPGATVFATFRLADSLPRAAMERWAEERDRFLATHPKPWNEKTWTAFRREFPERLEAWLDEAQGECLLRDPRIGAVVESALKHFDGDRYVLDAYAIMPNHVHVIFKPVAGHEMGAILHSWKSFTAKEINRRLGRRGQVWEHESFDHLLRSAAQLRKLRDYVRANPEMAGLSEGWLVGSGMGLELGMGREILGEEEAENWGVAASRRLVDTDEPSQWLAPTDEPSQRLAPTGESSRRLAPTIHLIVIATRKDGGDRSDISRHVGLAITAADQWKEGCRVVGVDLAGFEDRTTRAALFATDFEPVHRVGLAVTVHAGENDDAEGIWQAVFKLNARRLGHALHLNQSPDLRRAVADRGIGVEMCPYANVQIMGFAPVSASGEGGGYPEYPLKSYLDAGLRVTVNTDNIGISAASLTDNFLMVARLCPALTRMDILRLIAQAAATAFLSPAERVELLQRIEEQLTAGRHFSESPPSPAFHRHPIRRTQPRPPCPKPSSLP